MKDKIIYFGYGRCISDVYNLTNHHNEFGSSKGSLDGYNYGDCYRTNYEYGCSQGYGSEAGNVSGYGKDECIYRYIHNPRTGCGDGDANGNVGEE